MDLIQKLETEEIARLGKNIPDFKPGDTVVVNVNVVEGDRKRVQAYEGVVIAKKSRGLNSAFIVRKISSRRQPREALLPAPAVGQGRAHQRAPRRARRRCVAAGRSRATAGRSQALSWHWR